MDKANNFSYPLHVPLARTRSRQSDAPNRYLSRPRENNREESLYLALLDFQSCRLEVLGANVAVRMDHITHILFEHIIVVVVVPVDSGEGDPVDRAVLISAQREVSLSGVATRDGLQAILGRCLLCTSVVDE